MKRGRKSVDDRSNVVVGGFGMRPEPPVELTERQAEIWRETTASEPADFFATAALRAMLADYCRHREAADSLSGMISDFKAEWLKSDEGAKRYAGMLRMRDGEVRAASTMATKLRLTNQSRYRPNVAGTAARNAAKGPKPWEV